MKRSASVTSRRNRKINQLAYLVWSGERKGQLQRWLTPICMSGFRGARSLVASSSIRIIRGCDAFGEGFTSYRPPVDLKTTAGIHNIKPNGNADPAQLHHATPEWGITAPSDNLHADAQSRRSGDLAVRR